MRWHRAGGGDRRRNSSPAPGLWGLVCAPRAANGTQSGPRNAGGGFVGPGVRASRGEWHAKWAPQRTGVGLWGLVCGPRATRGTQSGPRNARGDDKDAKPAQPRNTINCPYPTTRDTTRDIYAN
ncbi:hypothetical protein ARTHRO9V_200125 [Arthrobacter sp. 9V]|nr:hypothetical protein ARTHRO9V_200125 [Arthrobacter sp. 9V]